MYDENGYVNDPQLLEQLNNPSSVGVAPQGASSASGYDEDAWVYKTEDASIFDTAVKKLQTANEAFWSTQVSEENSNFANAMARSKAVEYKEARDKLGMVGQIAAEAPGIAATIGAGLINPVAGGAVAAGYYTADNLANQVVEGQEADFDKALRYGIAGGALDAATGGVAGRIRAGMQAGKAAAPLAGKGFLPPTLGQRAAHAAGQAAPGVAVNLGEDIISSVGGTALSNVATGKNWDEGLGEAALLGAGAGTAIRGSLAGLNKVRQTMPNKGGQAALDNIDGMKMDNDINPSDTFTGEVYGYHNQYTDLVNEANVAKSPEARKEAIDAAINMAYNNGGRAADALALKIARENKLELMDHSFDNTFTSGMGAGGDSYHIGRELGIEDSAMRRSGEVADVARASRFNRGKAVKEGLTKEADQAKFQQAFEEVDRKMRKPFNDNITYVERLIEESKHNPNIGEDRVAALRRMRTDLRSLRSDMNSYVGVEKQDVSEALKLHSQRIMENASNLGILDDLKGLDGQFNPLVDIMAIDRMERMSRSRMPGVHNANPDKYKNKWLGEQGGNVFDAAMLATGNFLPVIARNIGKDLSALKSQSDLRSFKERTSQRLAGVQSALDARKRAAMEAGDSGAAAEAAAAQLQLDGLPAKSVDIEEALAPLDQTPMSPVEQEVAKTAPLIPRQPRQPVVQEPVPEVVPEVIPEPVMAERSAPLSARMPEQVQPQPVAPEIVPEPVQAPTPGSDSAGLVNAPRKPISEEVITEPEASPVEMTPQEAKARIAAQLQEQIQAGTAPRGKQVEPEKVDQTAVEEVAPDVEKLDTKTSKRSAPVSAKTPKKPAPKAEPTPEPEAPKPKPDMAKTPKQKEVETKVEEPEVTPSPEVEEPTVEAPRTSSKDLAGKPKQPAKDEPEIAPEAAQEPTVEVTPEVEEARTPSSELVRKPLQQMREEFDSMDRVERRDMLKTNPEKYYDMERAKADLKEANTIMEKLSSTFKTSEDTIGQVIEELGGMKGIRQKMRDEEIGGTAHDYVHRRVREFEDLKAKEAGKKLEELRAQAKEATKAPEVDPAALVEEIANKHINLKEELSSLGFNKAEIDEAYKSAGVKDSTMDFDPKIVRNWAKTAKKQKLEDARKAKDTAAEVAAKVVKKPTIKDSTRELNQYLKSVDGKEVPGVMEAVTSALKHRKSPLTEAQMVAVKNKVDSLIEAQRAELEAALKPQRDKTKALSPVEENKIKAKLSTLKSAQEQIAKNKAALEKSKAELEAKEVKAAEEAAAKQAEFDRIQKEVEEQQAKLDEATRRTEKLYKQKNDIKGDLMAAGHKESDIEALMRNEFVSRKEPLTSSQIGSLGTRLANKLDKLKEAKAEVAKNSVRQEVAKMDNGSLEAAAKDVLDLKDSVKNYSDPEIKGVADAIAEELKARGQGDEAAYMQAFSLILSRAEQRKAMHPDNKEFWILGSEKQTLQKLMNKKEGGSWMGNLQKQLSLRFFGDSEVGNKYMRLSQDEVDARIANQIDEDIVVKPKKSWKKLARKVNKQQ